MSIERVLRRVLYTILLQACASRAIEAEQYKVAYMALGCFWYGERAFECFVPGVINASDPSKCSTVDNITVSDRDCTPKSTVVGYMGGTGVHPTYENYTTANNYSETVRVMYDPTVTKYQDLLKAYWSFVQFPTVVEPDPAYQLRVFYSTPEEQQLIEESIEQEQKKFTDPVQLKAYNASQYTFWKAEEYHQRFDIKHGMTCQMTNKHSTRVNTK